MKKFDQKIIEILVSGGIGIIPTDTLYGLVGRSDNKKTVERIYTVRKRNTGKPCIILISSLDDLEKFNISISEKIKMFIEKNNIWPGKASVVLPCPDPSFEYLSRGTQTLAFRLPHDSELQELLSVTGPLVAPSANEEGNPPAQTIEVAQRYFKDTVDFYVDGGILDSAPSTLIRFENDEVVILREGAVKIV